MPPLVVDLHVHPSLKTWLGSASLARRETAVSGYNPFGLRSSYGSLAAGGVGVLCSSIYVPEHALSRDCVALKLVSLVNRRLRQALRNPPDVTALEMLRHVEEQVALVNASVPSSLMEVVRSWDELQRTLAAGRMAVVHTLEGAHALNGRLETLERFSQLGVAMITLAHFYPNGYAPPVDGIPDGFLLKRLGCFRAREDLKLGLTGQGVQLVESMFQRGIVVDLTHCTPRARQDVFALPNLRGRPLVMSHVGVRALHDHPMNPDDEEIRRIARSGGVVGVIFFSDWLFPQGAGREDRLANVVETVRHIQQVGGEDVVAFGSDFDGMTDPPDDLREPADFPRLLAALEEAGFTGRQIEKFAGRNFLRVLRAGWH